MKARCVMRASIIAGLPQGDGMHGPKPQRFTDQLACHRQWTDNMDPVSRKVEDDGRHLKATDLHTRTVAIPTHIYTHEHKHTHYIPFASFQMKVSFHISQVDFH